MYLKSLIFLLLFKRPMCLKHSKYCIFLTFQGPANHAKKLQKIIPKTYQHPPKFGPGSHQNGDSKKGRNKTSNKHANYRKIAPNGSPEAVIFWSSGSFFLCQDQSKPRFPLIVVDFGRFFGDFLYRVGYFLFGLPHYSNFWPPVQMCWGRP